MKTLGHNGRRSRYERGQSLVEMTVGFVIILIVLMGLLDLGRVYFIYVALEDGAGEAALYLSIEPGCSHSTDDPNPLITGECNDPNNAEYRARTSGGANVDWSNATITIDSPVISVGEPVSVRIEYPFKLVTPLISEIALVNPITLTVEASQIIVYEGT
jgi:Flp pilus assembly protein TadG